MAAETPQQDLTSEQALSLADSLFVDEAWGEAVDAYTAAETVLKEGQQESSILHFRIRNHRAAALIRLERYQDALQDATQATASLAQLSTTQTALLRAGETEWAWQRRGSVALKLGQHTKALAALEQAQQLAILNKRPSEVLYPAWIAECHANMVADKPTQTSTTTTTTTTSASAASPAPAAAKKAAPTNTITNPTSSGMPKYQYYQTDTIMTISILEPNVTMDNLHVEFETKHLNVILTKGGKSYTVISGNLYAEVDPEQCKTKIRPEKVLLKLKKVDKYDWANLLGKADGKKKSSSINSNGSSAKPTKTYTEATMEEAGADFLGSANDTVSTAATAAKENDAPKAAAADAKATLTTTAKPKVPRPYSSHKDWDSIERDIQEQEANEKPEGDEAMNKLFQQIYANADEDTRRAMIKSYQTSGGTCLSTNWGEVSSKDYEKERTAPKGMEWKNWEGDKLPQAKDDD